MSTPPQITFPHHKMHKSVMKWVHNILKEYAPSELDSPSIVTSFNNISTVLDKSNSDNKNLLIFNHPITPSKKYSYFTYLSTSDYGGFPVYDRIWHRYGGYNKEDVANIKEYRKTIHNNWKIIIDTIQPICGWELYKRARVCELTPRIKKLKVLETNAIKKVEDIQKELNTLNEELAKWK